MKEIELPLFPGYVFCRFDASDPYPVLNTTGVVHVVSAGKTPLPVDERELAVIQAICRSRLPIEPWPFLDVGQRVLVVHGPLKGAEGVVVQTKDEYRIVAAISMLQRSVATEIQRAWVKPVGGCSSMPRAGANRWAVPAQTKQSSIVH